MARKTIPQTVSFQPQIWNFLKERKNISAIVNEAIGEYKKARTTPESRIKLLKERKRELAKQMNEIDEKINKIK